MGKIEEQQSRTVMRESLAYYESSCDASMLPKMNRAPLPDIPTCRRILDGSQVCCKGEPGKFLLRQFADTVTGMRSLSVIGPHGSRREPRNNQAFVAAAIPLKCP